MQHRCREVKRRGQARGTVQEMNLSGAVDESHRALPADQVADAQPAVEVEQIGAAAEQDVLAVVELLAGLGLFERSGAATQGSSGFEQCDGDAGGFEGDGGGHAGEPAADDDDARRIGGCVVALPHLHDGLVRSARQPIRSLAQTESETRRRSTREGRAAIFFRSA
jgi:hypothetical protein